MKETSDISDACVLLELLDDNSLSLIGNEAAVRHFLNSNPGIRELLQTKVNCPEVLGGPWTFHQSSGMYWRWEGKDLWYLDEDLHRHRFERDNKSGMYYLAVDGHLWYFDPQTRSLVLENESLGGV